MINVPKCKSKQKFACKLCKWAKIWAVHAAAFSFNWWWRWWPWSPASSWSFFQIGHCNYIAGSLAQCTGWQSNAARRSRRRGCTIHPPAHCWTQLHQQQSTALCTASQLVTEGLTPLLFNYYVQGYTLYVTYLLWLLMTTKQIACLSFARKMSPLFSRSVFTNA